MWRGTEKADIRATQEQTHRRGSQASKVKGVSCNLHVAKPSYRWIIKFSLEVRRTLP